MMELIDELLETLDMLENDFPEIMSNPLIDMKRMIVSTNGFNKIGEREWPITKDNIKAWYSLREKYLAFKSKNKSLAQSMAIMLENTTFQLIAKSYNLRNEYALTQKLCKRWNI
jgi:hypothetical protein